MESEQEKEVYVLGLWECFGEMSICGVYTSKLKLIEGYQRVMDGDVRCHAFTDSRRDPVIYRFYANEFIGELPEWNDGNNGWTYVGDYATDILIRNDVYCQATYETLKYHETLFPISFQGKTYYIFLYRQLNNWLHKYLYKRGYDDFVGNVLRQEYENGKILNEQQFEEVLRYVLSCGKEV